MRRLIDFAWRRAAQLAARCPGLRNLIRGGAPPWLSLEGDRAIEWSWVVANLPRQPCPALDVGCVHSALSAIAARLGHQVTAVDLLDIEYDMQGVTFLRGDINELDFGGQSFSVIINSSTIEHVGLAGRYGAGPREDGDILAMRRLRQLLTPTGIMILTVPLGIDAVFAPFHRVYGAKRLPLLLEGLKIRRQEYWTRDEGSRWRPCDRDTALRVAGSASFYALGLFVLERSEGEAHR